MNEKKLDSSKEIGYLLDDQRVMELVENIRNSRKFSSSFSVTRGVIFLTSACNMSCYYCNSTRHPMPPWKNEQVIETINELAKNGARHIQWTGGEASLHPHMPEFVRLSSAHGMNNSISTNGASTSQRYIDLANAGINRFYISLDTLDDGEFDRVTGSKGYLQKVLKNILALVKYRDEVRPVHITVNITLNSSRVIELMRDDQNELKALLNWCIESGVDDFKFLPLEEDGSDRSNVNNLSALDDFIKACTSLVPSRYKMFHYRLGTLKTREYGLAKMQMCHCFHSLDDRAFDSVGAYACVIQLREGGSRIYEHDLPEYEKIQRLKKFLLQDRKNDPICNKFCFDLYRSINQRVEEVLGDDYPAILESIDKD
jgi:MoaA/NifB/PqqE/SkfB family radical SAM enzyme